MKYQNPASKLIIVAATAATLIGCGGGGGGGTSTPVNPSTSYRAPTAGDSWTWSLSGSGNGTGFTGSVTETNAADTFNSVACIRDTTTQTVTGGAVAVTTQWESAARAILGTQLNGAANPLTCTSDTIVYPTTVSSSSSLSGTASFSDGSSYSDSWAVTGSANVTVPAGTFACWIVTHSLQESSGLTETDTLWFVPALGNYVKETGTQTSNSGTFTYTYLLTATTVGGA